MEDSLVLVRWKPLREVLVRAVIRVRVMCFRERSYDLSDPIQGTWLSKTLDEMLGVPSYGLKSRSAGESTITFQKPN